MTQVPYNNAIHYPQKKKGLCFKIIFDYLLNGVVWSLLLLAVLVALYALVTAFFLPWVHYQPVAWEQLELLWLSAGLAGSALWLLVLIPGFRYYLYGKK